MKRLRPIKGYALITGYIALVAVIGAVSGWKIRHVKDKVRQELRLSHKKLWHTKSQCIENRWQCR